MTSAEYVHRMELDAARYALERIARGACSSPARLASDALQVMERMDAAHDFARHGSLTGGDESNEARPPA